MPEGSPHDLLRISAEVDLPDFRHLTWKVLKWRGTEELSAPYTFELDLFSGELDLSADVLLGTDLELLLDRSGQVRVFHGVIEHVRVGTSEDRQIDRQGTCVHVRVVPAFRMLDQDLRTRIFADKTVLEILREVLEPGLATYRRTVDLDTHIKDEYARRDYCVQFRESTFAFCSRLMEEEGIAYSFVPGREGAREVMVLFDHNAAYGKVDLRNPGPLPTVGKRAGSVEDEAVMELDELRTCTPNRVTTRGYDRNTAAFLDEGTVQRRDPSHHATRMHVLDEERRQNIDVPDCKGEQRARMAERIHDRFALEAATLRGSSNVLGFQVGQIFELGEHSNDALAYQTFLLTSVTHEERGFCQDDEERSADRYRNRFECIHADQIFRPARKTPSPRVPGLQLGTVVGPFQDEVHTDILGRVRVKLHLDRDGENDERASCWIPVARSWAGSGYGSVVIPRVGMEVVVAFVDGNPDCPIVTGCLYNGKNAPPLDLSEHSTRTTFRTASSPGGGGYNELRFEDAYGAEQVYVHAERRMDIKVRQGLYQTVGGSREERVGSENNGEQTGDHNTLVHGDVNHRVKSVRYLKIDRDQYTSVGGHRTDDVQGNHATAVAGTSQLTAPTIVFESSETLSCKSTELLLTGTQQIDIKSGRKLVLESFEAIELKVGGSFISIGAEGIAISGPLLRLNSGGGAGSARDALDAEPVELLEPLVAQAARAEVKHGGGGPRAARGGRTLEPHRAVPPPSPVPPVAALAPPDAGWFAEPAAGERLLTHLEWGEAETWCSEPATLQGTTTGYAEGETEFAKIRDDIDGSMVGTSMLTIRGNAFREPFEVTDLLPRMIGKNYEAERSLRGMALLEQTPKPLRMRFLPNLAMERCTHTTRFGHFDMMVLNHEVIIETTIFYVEGWLHSIIQLDATVPPGTGGDVGVDFGHNPGTFSGPGWRYCKMLGGPTRVYWDGAAWIPVPAAWKKTKRNVYSIAVWAEGGVTKTDRGRIPWPDPVPVWGPPERVLASLVLPRWTHEINHTWSGKFALKRRECRSTNVQCCRYPIRVNVTFVPTVTRGRGIALAPNEGRSNSRVWSLFNRGTPMAPHEFGHHLGNPDEYLGAKVNPAVNSDGARAGIDSTSLMGTGSTVKRRHFDVIGRHMAEMVRNQVGRAWHFDPVP